jgi:hypothetical protein
VAAWVVGSATNNKNHAAIFMAYSR